MDTHIGFAKALRGFFLRRWPAISHFVAGSAKRLCATEVQDHLICGNARLERQLCGVSLAAKGYIEDVQPYQQSREVYPRDSDRVRTGMAMLRDICNRDKHQRLLVANVRWTGEWLKIVNRASFYPMPKQDDRSYLDPRSAAGVEIVSHELQYGQALLITSGYREWKYLSFPVDAYFDRLPGLKNRVGQGLSVSEALDSCFEGTDMVGSRLRRMI